MREIHQGLPMKDFIRPSTGIIDVTVCAKSGLLKTSACNQGEITMPFLEGTEPHEYCNIHVVPSAYSAETTLQSMRSTDLLMNSDFLLDGLSSPVLSLEFLSDSGPRSYSSDPVYTDVQEEDYSLPSYNPLLD